MDLKWACCDVSCYGGLGVNVDGPTVGVIGSLVCGLPSPFNSSSCCCNRFGNLGFMVAMLLGIATSLYITTTWKVFGY